MTPAEVAALIAAIVSGLQALPQVASAVEGLGAAFVAHKDPTQAVKHLQAIAEAHALGIDPTGL